MKRIFKLIMCVVCSLTLLLANFIARAEENNNLGRLEGYLKKLKSSTPIPGFSVVVVKGDRIIYSKGFGEEIAGLNKPMTENTSTAIGSLTKSFTAMAIMQLVERGKISLEDPVIKYIPEFRTIDKEKSDKITVRMLLSNTSGIPSMDKWINISDSSPDAMERGVIALSSVLLSRNPGEDYEYSNEGFTTAGVIIERVSGMKYPEYIDKNILKPLKMERSTTDISRFDEFKVLFGHNPGVLKAIPASHFINTSVLAAGSEFRSSAENLSHYLIALLNGGNYEGNSVLSKDSIAELWKPQVSFPEGSMRLSDDGKVNYCLGWMSSTIDGRQIVHHGGNTLTASSYTMLYPEKDMAVSILYNLSVLDLYKYISMDKVTNNILHIVSDEDIDDSIFVNEKDPNANSYELPAEQNKRYIGEYVSASGDYRLKVTEYEGKALLCKLKNGWGTSESILDFASPSAVHLRNISMTRSGNFKIGSDGKVTGIEIKGLGNFSKLNSDMYENYNRVESPNNGLSFYIPKDYKIIWENTRCHIESPDGKVVIQGEIRAKELDGYNSFVKNSSVDVKGAYENTERTENIAGHLYREKSYTVKNGDTDYLRLLLYTEIENLSISFSAQLPYVESGEIVRNTVLPIMYSLDVK